MATLISTSWGSATDVGLLRQHNEDAFYAQHPVFVVADGMGGRAAGEVASELTSSRFGDLAASGDITVDFVNQAIADANGLVYEHSGSAKQLEGMGTTVVGLVQVTDREQELWLVFNIGDSRLYRMYQEKLVQITTDHTEVQEMVDMGSINSQEAKVHPLRHVITRAIGIDQSVEADIWLLPPVPGERFLLCSDGLSGEIPDSEIAEVLAAEADPSIAATRLVERALAAGGHDNVTVVVVDVFAEDNGDVDDTSPGKNGVISHTAVDPAADRKVGSEIALDPLIVVPFEREQTPQVAPDCVIVDVPVADAEGGRRGLIEAPVQEMIDAVPPVVDVRAEDPDPHTPTGPGVSIAQDSGGSPLSDEGESHG